MYLEELEKIEPKSMGNSLPIIWDKAKGYNVWDIFGNKYIDFTSTIFVTNTGHSQVSEDIIKQSRKLIHSYMFPNLPRINLIKELYDFLPDFCENIYLASAGSEVTSWAINLMREYSKKNTIIYIDGAFHGKTGQIEQLDKEGIRISFPLKREQFIEDLPHLICNKDIAGIMIESYQGWSARFMDKDYIKDICKFTSDNDIPVCFDEIQGGFFRTGRKFAYEHYEIEPDLICLGKALGGGLPISALSGRRKYFKNEQMTSTHSANPLCCSAAISTLKYFNISLDMKKLYEIMNYFERKLRQIQYLNSDFIVETNVKGLLGSLIFKDKQVANNICHKAMRKGLLLVKTNRESIKIGPPLIIDLPALQEGLDVLEKCIREEQNDTKYSSPRNSGT